MTPRGRAQLLETLTPAQLELLDRDWPLWSRETQRPAIAGWRTWLMLGGRGADKTRAGAQWLHGLARGDKHFLGDAAGHVALVGETYADARAVMIEGESGLLAIAAPHERPQWNPSLRQLYWPGSGVVGRVFSASDPDGLRGAQFGAAWCDEIAKWAHVDETWDMLAFCLRLGRDPRRFATTTPKPLGLFRRLIADPSTTVSRSPTADNAGNLAPGFLDFLSARYGGTRLGRQELDGEIVEDREDALWQRVSIEACRRPPPRELARIVVGVDPPAGGAAACGIVAAGIDMSGRCHVLEDASVARASPTGWASAAVALYERLSAGAIVAEINQGGDMVRSVIGQVAPSAAIREVRATRGKWLRAEPVAALYEQGRVFHARPFPQLEDEMCAFGLDGLADGVSPDRLDALVWAITDLALTNVAMPRVRGM
ncbi:MAG: terminase family protein [Pseudomonadota bacterium]|nr:terminase family protein [Pseudomonadota bacterium]